MTYRPADRPPSPWLAAQPAQWIASTELFPRDFSRFVLTQNLDQLMSGMNAHTFRNYEDFARFIAPPANAQPNLAQMPSQGANQFASMSSSLATSGLGFRFVNVDGTFRPYTLVLPRNYNPGRAYPVIIGYGGWQHDAARTRSYEQLERAAGDRAIVVYP